MSPRASATDPRSTAASGTASPRPAALGGDPVFAEPIFVTRPIIPDRDLYAERVGEIFSDQWLTNNGPQVLELERLLTQRLGVGFCAAFSSGTTALLTALRALDLQGDVITTPFTFPATPHCIEWNGLRPVFCDIDPDTYNLDVESMASMITPETCALLPVHVFGNPCDVHAIQRIAQERNLNVVYDAAHAFGVSLEGVPIGCFGDLSVLSFHATKVFHTAEGGAIVGSDTSRFEKLALLRNFGIVDENEVRGVGLNGKMSELHAAVGRLVLDQLEVEIAGRRAVTSRYTDRLGGIDGLKFQRFDPGVERTYFNLTIEIEEEVFGLSRDALHTALRAENIVARKYFHPLCSENECYRELPSARRESLPNAARVSSQIMSLPHYGALTMHEVDAIADAIVRIQCHAPSLRES
jgi:dTDP-4-amino-4,6-dideoxygalactose transaminase